MDYGKHWSRPTSQHEQSSPERHFTFRNGFDAANRDVATFHQAPKMLQEEVLSLFLSTSTLDTDARADLTEALVRDPATPAPPLVVTAEHAELLANSWYDTHANERFRKRSGAITWDGAHPVNRLITAAVRELGDAKRAEDRAFTNELLSKSEKNPHPFLLSVNSAARGDVRTIIQNAIADRNPLVRVRADVAANTNTAFTPEERADLVSIFETEYEVQGEGINLHALNQMNFISTGKREGAATADRLPPEQQQEAEGRGVFEVVPPREAGSGAFVETMNDDAIIGTRMRGEIVRTVTRFFAPLQTRLQPLTINRLVADSFVVGTNSKVGENIAKMIAHIQAGNRAHAIRMRDIRVLGDNEVAVGEQLTAIATGIQHMIEEADIAFIEGLSATPQESALLQIEMQRTGVPRNADVILNNWWNPTRMPGMPLPGTAVTTIAGRTTPPGCQLPLESFQPTPVTTRGVIRTRVTGTTHSRAQDLANQVHRYLSRQGRDRAVSAMMRDSGVPMPSGERRDASDDTSIDSFLTRDIEALLNS